MTFAIITPTIGSPTLRRCIQSVQNQTLSKDQFKHYIVLDGQEHTSAINSIMLSAGITQNMRFIALEENVGKGWYGHRVYAASSFLVNEDVLCYLDEDNFLEPDYLESFITVLNNHTWGYTLRKIVNVKGEFICDDNCESLGQWPVSFDPKRYHIDTGCFAVPRSLAVKVGHHWYGQWGADRQFFAALQAASPNFGCTNKHTLNYRLGGETSQATQHMFEYGNKLSSELYKGDYPWHNQKRKQPTILTYHTIPTNP